MLKGTQLAIQGAPQKGGKLGLGSFIDRKTLFSYSEALFAWWGEWDRISGRCSLGVV